MTLSVHYLRELDPAALDRLRGQLQPDITFRVDPEIPQPADYHILITGRPKREHLTASSNLHTLIIPWAGLPVSTRDLMLEFPTIAVHNLHHNAAPVAELTVTLMLTAAKSIVPIDRAFREHDWRPRYRPDPTPLLAGKTALILGYGAIGRRVGEICLALNMKVLAVRRRADESQDGVAPVYPAGELAELLPRTDVLLICLPHTPDTDGLIGAAELELMPAGGILVNIGRGAIVDEAALYHALRDGQLHSAGLDVWYNYPTDAESRAHTPPSTFPFHELDNVVMSPHRAGHSDDTEELRMAHLAELLNAAARGEPMFNRVDLQAGY